MKVIHIGKHQGNKIKEVNQCISSGYDVFVLVYLEGCGPCNATRPEWSKLEATLSSQYANKKIAIVDVDSELYKGIHGIGSVEGFPSIKYIKYNKTQTFDNSGIKCSNRTIDCFVQWIEHKIQLVSSTHTHNSNITSTTRKTRIKTNNRIKGNKRMTGGRKKRKSRRRF
jgi:hypothetical protein